MRALRVLIADDEPDAVILDLGLAHHSGLEVARELRQCYGKDCPVLICVTGRRERKTAPRRRRAASGISSPSPAMRAS